MNASRLCGRHGLAVLPQMQRRKAVYIRPSASAFRLCLPPSDLGGGDCVVHDLGDLAPRSARARPELQAVGAATVPGYDLVEVRRFDVLIERVGGGYVPERGTGRVVEGPALCYDHYLA